MKDDIAHLDTRGKNCPLPILMTRKALKDLAVGDVLRVLASDPGSVRDMAAFCGQTGHDLIASETEPNGAHAFVIRKA